MFIPEDITHFLIYKQCLTFSVTLYWHFSHFQTAVTCSKLTIETLEQGVKDVQS